MKPKEAKERQIPMIAMGDRFMGNVDKNPLNIFVIKDSKGKAMKAFNTGEERTRRWAIVVKVQKPVGES